MAPNYKIPAATTHTACGLLNVASSSVLAFYTFERSHSHEEHGQLHHWYHLKRNQCFYWFHSHILYVNDTIPLYDICCFHTSNMLKVSSSELKTSSCNTVLYLCKHTVGNPILPRALLTRSLWLPIIHNDT